MSLSLLKGEVGDQMREVNNQSSVDQLNRPTSQLGSQLIGWNGESTNQVDQIDQRVDLEVD